MASKKHRSSIQKPDSLPETKLQAAAGQKRKLITKSEETGAQFRNNDKERKTLDQRYTLKLRSNKGGVVITDESTQAIQHDPIINVASYKRIRKEECMQAISNKDGPMFSTSSGRKEEESGQDLKHGIRKRKAGKISTDAAAIEQGEQQKKARDRLPQILSGLIAGKKMTLFSFNVGGDIEESSFKIGGWSGIWAHRLSNSVNGLAFAYGIYGFPKTTRNFYLLNPSTQEYSALPMSRQEAYANENFGFGFDSSSGAYKVVRIFSHENEDMRCSCEILTLGTAEWKCIGEILSMTVSTPVFVNEHLYWMALIPDGNGTCMTILSFDVKHEKFGFKSPPDSKNCLHRHIMELESHLCFVAMRCIEPEPQIRISKLIDGSIWVKFYHIKLDHWALPFPARTVIGTVGKMLLFYGWEDHVDHALKLLYCDLQKGTMHQILEAANPRLLIHKESLVSPRNLLRGLDAC